MAITNSQINSEFSGIAVTDASGLVIGLDVDQLAVANVANLTIPGGTAGQVLSTDGNGVLSWVPATGGITQIATQGTQTFIATSAQTSFTLARTTNGTVTGSINGVQAAATAFVVSGTTATYVRAQNSGYSLKAGDQITITYLFGSTSASSISGLNDVIITSPAAGQVLTYNTTSASWVNVPGATSFGLVANGTSNVTVANNGNVTVGVAGTANVARFANTGVTVSNLTVSGTTASLGNIGGVKITGGANGQAIQSLGGGDLAFVNPTKLVTYAFSNAPLTWSAGFVPTTVIYSTKLYDPQSLYDAATGRFQPKVAGWYQIVASADSFVNNSENGIQMIHNVDGLLTTVSGINQISDIVIGTAFFNGTTDFAFVQVLCSSAGTRNQTRGRTNFTATYLGL